MQHREQELREKQEQLVQAGKLATLGELTTGVAHELNNPLNNIGLFVGNVIDHAGNENRTTPGRHPRELRAGDAAGRQGHGDHLRTCEPSAGPPRSRASPLAIKRGDSAGDLR